MINKKTIECDGLEYIVEQPSAIKALGLSALTQRIQASLTKLSVGNGDFSGDVLETDLNSLLFNNELIKIVTGKTNAGLTKAKVITKDSELPNDLANLGELIGLILGFMFKVDDEISLKKTLHTGK